MSKKFERLLALLISVLLIAGMMPEKASAAGKIDPNQPASLTIRYRDGGKVIPNAHFSLYQVADIDAYADMTLTQAFKVYRYTASGLADLDDLTQDQWMALASTLHGYALIDDIAPTAEGTTDVNGMITFRNLKVGLYLVAGSRVTTDDFYTYTASPFMLFLPNLNMEDNDWEYDIEAEPKSKGEYTPPHNDDRYVTRKVLKVWKDAGYEALRPESVTVHLLRDGEIYDTQELNEANNWRYAWDNLRSIYEWEVVEEDAKGYAVTMIQNGITFIATNQYIEPSDIGIKIEKRLVGEKPKTEGNFTFVLTARDDTCPMPEGSEGQVKKVTLTGVGAAGTGEIRFADPGTYVYTIHEENGGVKGYVYDSTVYTLTFEVTEEDGVLSVIRTIKDDKGRLVEDIVFTNGYGKIPQTGALWWPVPILFGAGLVLMTLGLVSRRRDQWSENEKR